MGEISKYLAKVVASRSELPRAYTIGEIRYEEQRHRGTDGSVVINRIALPMRAQNPGKAGESPVCTLNNSSLSLSEHDLEKTSIYVLEAQGLSLPAGTREHDIERFLDKGKGWSVFERAELFIPINTKSTDWVHLENFKIAIEARYINGALTVIRRSVANMGVGHEGREYIRETRISATGDALKQAPPYVPIGQDEGIETDDNFFRMVYDFTHPLDVSREVVPPHKAPMAGNWEFPRMFSLDAQGNVMTFVSIFGFPFVVVHPITRSFDTSKLERAINTVSEDPILLPQLTLPADRFSHIV